MIHLKRKKDIDAYDDDKFIAKTYNDRPLYERKPGFDVSLSEMDIELKLCLGFYNKLYNYDSDFVKEDFEALDPIKLEKNDNGSWIPFYNVKRTNDDKRVLPYKNDISASLVCCCSQKCGSLYLIRNKVTDVYFGLGSVCITKFINENFDNKVSCLKYNATRKKCDICNDTIHIKTTKDNKSNWSTKNKILDKIICNKCICKTIVILNIKYSEKDEFKKKYSIYWSVSGKTWFVKGRVPKGLQNRIVRIE